MTRITTTTACFAAVFALSIAVHAEAQSPCTQPDVVAFVNQSRQSHDLDAPGINQASIQESRLPAQYPGRRFNARTVVCSAWVRSRNPDWTPGSNQARFVRTPQSFWVSKLESGYEVGMIPQNNAKRTFQQ